MVRFKVGGDTRLQDSRFSSFLEVHRKIPLFYSSSMSYFRSYTLPQIYMFIESESLLFTFFVAVKRPAFFASAASHTHLFDCIMATCSDLICFSGQFTDRRTGVTVDGGGCGIWGNGRRTSNPGFCSISRIVMNEAEGERRRFGGWKEAILVDGLNVEVWV